ncbi:Protein sirB1 [Paramagnetospirillum magnetotacticum MS-1]|uniref:Protein sirB1 n=1 Tax=Paramagnetospirillum magnetotacticum MS-1 TaxID=272627 RepID=A0A0C2YDX6_PARME|nr:transglutaminase-like domain-containing protein [Paramagnetospirillum magnetotacticum]KIL97909.1 Protein sirB1 [Paramagnetospirillum magnetotacticum MS-1]
MSEAAILVRDRLTALGRMEDCDLDPAESLLLLAALGRAGSSSLLDVTPYLARLDGMAAELRAEAMDCPDAASLAARLFHLLGRRHRFQGDERDDDDLGDLDLLTVMDQRRGGNDALGLLALTIARRAGMVAEGLAFPAHFLLRLGLPSGSRAIVDPLGGGLVLTPPDLRAMLKAAAGLEAELEPAHYTAMSNRDLLLRLGNAAKLRLLRLGHVERALSMVESLLLVAPDTCLLWREAGLMHMRLDHTAQAVAALEQFLGRTPNAQAKARTLALLAELKRRIH